jgi:hypothetical protein
MALGTKRPLKTQDLLASFRKIALSGSQVQIQSEKELLHRPFVSAVVHKTQSLKTKYFLGSFGNSCPSSYWSDSSFFETVGLSRHTCTFTRNLLAA